MTQQINLYETRLRPSRELATAYNVGMAAAVLLVLMVGLSLYAGHQARQKAVALAALQEEVNGAQEKMAALTRAVSERHASPALVSELVNAQALLASRQEVMDVLDSGRVGNATGFSGYMYGFSRQAQTDLWLTGFRISSGGAEIEIRGRVLDPARLPVYVQHLSDESIFRGRRFAALDMRSVEPVAPVPDSAGTTPSAPPEAVLPRFVEFVLRSENAGVVTDAASGAKP